MATIRQRQPGVWEVRVFTGRDEDGRPTQVSRTVRGGKREAQRVAAELTTKPAPRIAGRTVADVLDAWIEANLPTWAESTKRDNQSRVDLVKCDPIVKVQAGKVGVADIERWHTRLRRAGTGESSLVNQHRILRAALAQAVRWGWLTVNPASLARLRHPRRQPRGAMSAEDVQVVLAAARTIEARAELALRIAAVTGARRSELAALRWEDLDGTRLRIDSAIGTVRLGSRSDKRTPELVDQATKTANRRAVTIDTETIELFGKLRSEFEEYGPWVLNLGDRPANPDRIGAWWRLARKRAGIDPIWRLHDLRHWSATQAIAAGHDIRTVANRLGHVNPAMTLRVYAHAVEQADQAVADGLARTLEPADRPAP
ncbi:MAG: tyrosine-type recombinase/integrase [Acidimicrobiales bacterium]